MTRIPRHSLHALLCSTALALASPALGQSFTPKDALSAFEAFVTGAGGDMSAGTVTREGDAILASGAVLRIADRLQARFPVLRLEPRGGDVAMTTPEGFSIISTLGTPGALREYEVRPQGAFLLSLDEGSMGLGLDFTSLTVANTVATRNGRPLNEALTMTIGGLNGRFGLTLTEPYQLDGTLRASTLDYDMTASDPSMSLSQRVVSRSQAQEITLSLAGLRDFDTDRPGWVAAAFADGFAARLGWQSGQSVNDIDQTMGGTRSQIHVTSASSQATMGLEGGSLTLDTSADGNEIRVQMEGGIGGQGTLARLAFGMELPVIRTEDDRRFGLSMGLTDLRLDPQLLAMVGAQSFADDAATLEIDVEGQGRWLVEITEDPDSRAQPADFTSFSLNGLTTRLGAAALTGSGALQLAPGALARMGDGPPDGEGEFTFELRGGQALLQRLSAAGLLPPDQLFGAQMAIGMFGQSVGEDHLRSVIGIRPGGQILINGAPAPF